MNTGSATKDATTFMQPQTRVYAKGVLQAEGFEVARVSDFLAESDTVVWVDLCGPSLEQLHELADELGLHELAVEDALGPHQRPKLDHYDTHLFFSCHAVSLDRDAGDLRTNEIDAFIGDRWLITVRKDEGFSMGAVLEHWDRSPTLAAFGVSFLLYGLLDVVIDGYFDTVSVFDEYYDDVAEGIFSDQPLPPDQQKHWFRMRQALIQFHRLALPLREAVSGLMRHDQMAISGEIYPYYQDVYDHILRVSDSTDALARPGEHHRRDELELARLPPKRGHEEGDELGGHHRGPHADHRVLRHERPVPWSRTHLGRVGVSSSHRRVLARALHTVPKTRLVVAATYKRSPVQAAANGTSRAPRSERRSLHRQQIVPIVHELVGIHVEKVAQLAEVQQRDGSPSCEVVVELPIGAVQDRGNLDLADIPLRHYQREDGSLAYAEAHWGRLFPLGGGVVPCNTRCAAGRRFRRQGRHSHLVTVDRRDADRDRGTARGARWNPRLRPHRYAPSPPELTRSVRHADGLGLVTGARTESIAAAPCMDSNSRVPI